MGNVANITVNSSGNSLTYFHTSDTYTGKPLFSSATDGSTYDNVANGFQHNDCFATGTTAIAHLSTSASGADEFGGVPAFSFVQGPSDSYDCYAVGFVQVTGSPNGNTAAQAFLGMSTNQDTYTCDDTQHTDTIQGAGGSYTIQANGFSNVFAYAASFTNSKAIVITAAGDTFVGTYSRDQVLSAGGSYNHYLFGFPQVEATGNTNTVAYLQKFSASDFFMDDTTAADLANGLGYTEESGGTNYHNKATHFTTIQVSVYPN